MNLQKLFNMQKQLDDHIMDEHPELKGQNNLDWKILALQVELGECANEWRGFKKWSNDQEPRTDVCSKCKGKGEYTATLNNLSMSGKCNECHGKGHHFKNPLLEEYVDCLHFILSIGLELGIKNCVVDPCIYDEDSVTNQFIEINYQSHLVMSDYKHRKGDADGSWFTLLDLFAGLGQMLGFTWDQIEQAYLDKNAVNHKRQNNGY